MVAIVARQEIRSIFVKNKAYFGKNRPYSLTGRWAAAWAKFGSTFFPHIFVWGSCFWFCIPPPPPPSPPPPPALLLPPSSRPPHMRATCSHNLLTHNSTHTTLLPLLLVHTTCHHTICSHTGLATFVSRGRRGTW